MGVGEGCTILVEMKVFGGIQFCGSRELRIFRGRGGSGMLGDYISENRVSLIVVQ